VDLGSDWTNGEEEGATRAPEVAGEVRGSGGSPVVVGGVFLSAVCGESHPARGSSEINLCCDDPETEKNVQKYCVYNPFYNGVLFRD